MSEDDRFARLYETALWKAYFEKDPSEERKVWVKKVYGTAIEWLKLVPKTFPNYTLHDETHVLNVMTAMAGLLGDQIGKLSLCECELLILAASLHDIGMVYTDEAIRHAASDTDALRGFQRAKMPDKYGAAFEELRENSSKEGLSELQQDYLRSLHPYRVSGLLQDLDWGFPSQPSGMISREVIAAVCESHGREENYLESCQEFVYLPATQDADPRFCALLLRLGDILDFDGSRAPKILSEFARGIKRSEEAFDKHGSSEGFIYSASPSDQELGYRARCLDPDIHSKLIDYLDWVKEELQLADRLKRRCEKDWQRNFPFPRGVSRSRIECPEFESEPFSVTMDQEQILGLLTGENLYKDRGVFVRELLQNAIDATLLRGKMDPRFVVESEAGAIYIWSGFVGEKLIFRIDDHGTGMTREMLRRYFLNIGKSYYESEELKRDLLRHGCEEPFLGISRFGIGFLSCFLCGYTAEVSTLYFDSEKAKDECGYRGAAKKFGLRVAIPGLKGHYALHNQAKPHHISDALPFPIGMSTDMVSGLEFDGYRREPGTSIVISLDPKKLGMIDLKAEVIKYLCVPRMMIYYNGERIGRTYSEMLEGAQRLNGTTYELSNKDKSWFDRCFPKYSGNYPRFVLSVQIIKTPEFPVPNGVTALTWTLKPFFDKSPEWCFRDQRYRLRAYIETPDGYGRNYCCLEIENCTPSQGNSTFYLLSDSEIRVPLENAFSHFERCPSDPAELGTVWQPFIGKMTIEEAWRAWADSCVGVGRHSPWSKYYPISMEPQLLQMSGNPFLVNGTVIVSSQGVIAGAPFEVGSERYALLGGAMFLFEGSQRPDLNLGRDQIKSLPIEAALALQTCLAQARLPEGHEGDGNTLPTSPASSLKTWRTIREQPVGQWALQVMQPQLSSLKAVLQRNSSIGISAMCYDTLFINTDFLLAILQDNYDLHVRYDSEGCFIQFIERKSGAPSEYDRFPPMPFCYADVEESCRFLCTERGDYRKGITSNHPYAAWLLENAAALECEFPSHWETLVHHLKEHPGDSIREVASNLRSQLISFRYAGLTTIPLPPELTENDFWNR